MIQRAHADAAAGMPRRGRRLRVRSLLLLVALVPTLGLVALATSGAATSRSTREDALAVEADTRGLVATVEARVAIANEQIISTILTTAGGFGASAEEVSAFFGVDYPAQLANARAAVDANPILQDHADELAGLTEVRTSIDAGQADFSEADAVFTHATTVIDAMWSERFDHLERQAESAALPGSAHDRLRAVRATFDALTAGSTYLRLTAHLLLEGPDLDELVALVDASTRFDAATERFGTLLGPGAAAAWAAHEAAPESQRYDATRRRLLEAALAGTTSELTADPAAYGQANLGSAVWASGLADTVQAAGLDLAAEATHHADAATSALLRQLAAAAAITAASLGGAILLTRRFTGPIQRLEAAARAIREGRFDLDPIDTGGPRELADTARSFNEMALTLQAVEMQAVTLASDPDASIAVVQSPGRTGEALQAVLDRLQGSMRESEQQRRELELAATHDGLTGLLNRTAAFGMIERDLARLQREPVKVAALFIDLDELKVVNDLYGHEAGDTAVKLTAAALRDATRQSDVVARLSGDEFVVVAVVTDGAEASALAERVRAAVADQVVDGPLGRIHLHCSIGIALGGSETTSVDALVHDADLAMYAAKRAGRDRIAVHPAEPPAGDATPVGDAQPPSP
jgi:diguanylate cyclase (GGDEF)-like protein